MRHVEIGGTNQPFAAECQFLASGPQAHVQTGLEAHLYVALTQIHGIVERAGSGRRVVSADARVLRLGEEPQPGNRFDAEVHANAARIVRIGVRVDHRRAGGVLQTPSNLPAHLQPMRQLLGWGPIHHELPGRRLRGVCRPIRGWLGLPGGAGRQCDRHCCEGGQAPMSGHTPARQTKVSAPHHGYRDVVTTVVAGGRPSDVAVTLMRPAWPACERTISRASPLKAFRWSAWNGSTVAALPLSTASILPAPSTLNCTRLSASGQKLPSLSSTRTVMKERSWPSAAILARSGVSAAGRVPRRCGSHPRRSACRLCTRPRATIPGHTAPPIPGGISK